MLRRLALLLLLISGCATLEARFFSGMQLFPLTHELLPSGLIVLTEVDARTPLAGVVWVVGSGSASDPPGKEGLAHLVEHLVFASSHARESDAHTTLQNLGAGALNASTDFDQTTYYAYAHKDALPTLLPHELDRMANPLRGVDEGLLKREALIVTNELLLRTESSDVSRVFPPILERAFPGSHPYRRYTGGTVASIANITLADVRAFVAEHYKASNMTLMVSGDIGQTAVLPLLPNALRGDAAAPQTRRAIEPPVPNESTIPVQGMTKHKAHLRAPELWIAWQLPAGSLEADIGADLAAYLGAWLTSSGSFRESDPDIDRVNVSYLVGRQGACLLAHVTLVAATHPEKTGKDVARRIEWALNPQARAFRAEDHAVVRDERITRWLFGLDSPYRRAIHIATRVNDSGDPLALPTELNAYARLDIEKALTRLHSFVRIHNARIALVEPGALPADPLTLQALPVKKLAEPVYAVPGPTPKISAPKVHTTVAGNGMTIAVVEQRGLPLVTLQLGFHGGLVGAPPGIARFAESVRKSIDRWELRFPFAEDGWLNRDMATETYSSTTGEFSKLLRAVAAMPSASPDKWPNTWLNAEAKKQSARYDRPRIKAYVDYEDALFGVHPYASNTAIKTLLGKVDEKQVRDWFTASRAGGNTLVVIVGDVDAESTLEEARTAFSGWPKGKILPAPLPLPMKPRALDDAVIVHEEGARQVDVRLGCAIQADSGVAADLTLLDASLSSAFYRAVRQQLGAAYDVSVGASRLWGNTAVLEMEAHIGRDQLGDALPQILSMWRDHHMTESALAFEKARIASTQAFRFVSTKAVAGSLVSAWSVGEVLDSLPSSETTMAARKAEDVARTFSQCRSVSVLSLVGDEATINAAYARAFGHPPRARTGSSPFTEK